MSLISEVLCRNAAPGSPRPRGKTSLAALPSHSFHPGTLGQTPGKPCGDADFRRSELDVWALRDLYDWRKTWGWEFWNQTYNHLVCGHICAWLAAEVSNMFCHLPSMHLVTILIAQIPLLAPSDYLGLNMPATTAASSTWLMCPPRVRYSNGNVHVSRFFPPTKIWWDVTLFATLVTFENWIPQNSMVNQWIIIPTAPNTFWDCIWSCFWGSKQSTRIYLSSLCKWPQ